MSDDKDKRQVRLHEDQLDYIIKGVKSQILDEIYADIGKGVVKRILWMLGVGGTGIAAYFAFTGHIK